MSFARKLGRSLDSFLFVVLGSIGAVGCGTSSDAGQSVTGTAYESDGQPEANAYSAPPDLRNQFTVGVCAFDNNDFQRIAAAGIKSVRMDKPTASTIERARSFGIEPLAVAAYNFSNNNANDNARLTTPPQNLAAWASRMVDTWRGMSNPPKVIEVWNEPWLRGFWNPKPDPVAYLELVKAFANEVWSVWPDTTLLVSGDQGMSDYPNFRRDMLAADTSGFLNDGRIRPVTHNYVESRTPTTTTSNACTYDLNRYRCAYEDFKAHGHPNPQVWVTEFGWESDTPGGRVDNKAVSESLQAAFTVQAIDMFRNSGMVAAAYSFLYKSNDPWSFNWLRPDNSEKPVVSAVRDYLSH